MTILCIGIAFLALVIGWALKHDRTIGRDE
jgi:hypothetical protein